MLTYLNSDAWVEMPKLENESFDLVLTDPPYMAMNSVTECRKGTDGGKIIGVFDSKDFDIFAKHYWRLLKPGRHAYIFTQEKVYSETRKAVIEAGFQIRGTLIWVKRSFTKGNFDLDYPIQTEMILYCHKRIEGVEMRKLNGNVHSNILTEFPNLTGHQMIHPTQKPVSICQFLIERSSEEGEFILDPFAGVGTTLLAARACRRNAWGCELLEEFWKKGMFLIEANER